jgi:molybdopterin-guanine dinucleotide biosynthesis protein A
MPSATHASAIILAGGRSSRIGQPKAMLDFGGKSILERIVEELSPHFDDVVIVAAPESAESFDIQIPSARIIRDETAFAGPLDALRRGLLAARNAVVFACSCDLPMLKSAVAIEICAMVGAHAAAIPTIGGRVQPLCAAYRTSVADSIATLLASGEQRLTALADALDARRVTEDELRRVDSTLASFVNVNTPADYARALKLARGES